MVKWVVVLSLLSPEGAVVKTQDVTAYAGREACEAVKPIRLMHVLDVLAKYHMKLISADCLPDGGE